MVYFTRGGGGGGGGGETESLGGGGFSAHLVGSGLKSLRGAKQKKIWGGGGGGGGGAANVFNCVQNMNVWPTS